MAKRGASTRKRVTKSLLICVMCGDQAAIQELGVLGPSSVPRLLTAFQGPHPPDTDPRDVWDHLTWALTLAVERDAEPLLKILNGEVAGDEGLAVCAIGKSRDPRVSDALLAALNHKSSFVREHAARALIERRETNALDKLLPRICDRSTSVGSSIVFGILGASKLQDVRAIPYLERFAARKSVQRLPGLSDRTQRLSRKLKAKQKTEVPTQVDLSEERITVKRLRQSLASRSVKSINLEEAKGVSDAVIAAIAESRQLEELSLEAYSVRTIDLSPLVELKCLKSLYLRNNQINVDCAQTIGRITSLECLGLAGTGFADKHAVHLSKLTRLRQLSLDRRITDIGLQSISALTNLEELSMYDAQITAEGLVHFGQLKKLRSLRLDGAKIGDDGIKHLTKFRRLEVLRLRDCGLTDEAFASLVKFKRLKYLDLTWNSLTDKGFKNLPILARLEGIDIRGTQVTGKTAAHLIKLQNLKELLASGTKLDRVARQRLRRKLPNCRIDERPWHLSYGRELSLSH